MSSLGKSISRDHFKSLSLMDPSDPIWVLGPSLKLNNYKDFILKNLKDKNTIAVSHTFSYLVLNWSFLPNFFCWHDPHQTISTSKNFTKIENSYESKNKKCTGIVSDFVRNEKTFPVSSGFGNNKNQWQEYKTFQEKLKKSKSLSVVYASSIFLHSLSLGCAPPLSGVEKLPTNINLADKLCTDLDYRFEQSNFTTFGSRKAAGIENILTSTVLPLLHFMNFKKVFIMGFDGNRKRLYGDFNCNQAHGKFIGLDQWIKWSPFHHLDLFNLQNCSPLSRMIKTIPAEASLEYV